MKKFNSYNRTRELTTMEQIFIEKGLRFLLHRAKAGAEELSEKRLFELELLVKELNDTKTVKITPYK